MSNVNWIVTRKHLTVARVDADLRRLIAKKFGDTGKVVDPDPRVIGGYWEVEVPFDGGVEASVGVTFATRNRITFKPGGYEVSMWLETWLRNELGVLYHGVCRGEHDPKERWGPDNTRYRTYRKYVQEMHAQWTPRDRELLLDGLGEMVDQ